MTGFDITRYPTKVLLQVYKEASEEILQDTKDLLKKYDFKHSLEAEIKRRGLDI
jgi:hypothetical protein